MITSIFTFFIVLSLLVLIHEWGHFIACKRSGIWVEEFGFGLPPRIWGKKIGETIYSINWLPFGGFVRPHGETSEDGVTKPERSLFNKSKAVRAKVAIAGVIMNFILAIVAFGVVYTFSGIPKEIDKVKVLEVLPNSPASVSGIETGDYIKSVGGEKVSSIDSFIAVTAKFKGKETDFVIERNGNEIILKSTPRENPPEGEGSLGIAITSSENYFPPFYQRPFYGIYYGFKEALFWGNLILDGLGQMIEGLFKGVVPKDVAGPVGIYALTTQAASFGLLSLINFLGVLSVNLAILNILPFPALDGGRLLFIGIESIFGKRVLPKAEAIIHTAGMIILLLLIVLITAGDIRRLIVNGGITGFLDSFTKP